MSVFGSGPRITPFLWFDSNAEEAVEFYLTVFRNARRVDEMRTAPMPQNPTGGVLTVAFELDGQRFVALNGGPMFRFTEAVSFVVRCDSQEEADYYWSRLSDGGSEGRCGWLKDRFGLSWQVVPTRALELMRHPKALQALMGMGKLDIAALEKAAQE